MPDHLATWSRAGRWQALTASRHKFDLYSADADFGAGLAAWTQLGSTGGDHHRARAQRLGRHALLIIQPDCLAKRVALECLSIVRERGFAPVAVHQARLGPAMVAAIWRYQSRDSTPQSRRLAELVCGAGDSVVVLLRDVRPEADQQASARLTALKGPSPRNARQPWQLRSRLDAPGLVIVLVHTSDEPADLLRELHIVAPEAITDLLSAIDSPALLSADEPATAIDALYQQIPAHDLDPHAAMRRLRALAGASERGGDALRLLEAAELELAQFTSALTACEIDPHSWDALLVANQRIDHGR